MYFTRKSMSEASKTIFKEQRELRFLSRLSVLPIRMQCRYPSVSEHPEEHIYLEQMNLGEIFLFV